MRLTFPNDPTVERPGTAPGAFKQNASGATALVYADPAGTVLADIQTVAGQPVPGSALTVNASSRLPDFLGPDNADTLYVTVSGGPLTAMYARSDDRLDAIESVSLPRDHGLLSWTTDPATPTAGKIAVSGTVYLASLRVTRTATATRLLWGINTAGVTPTAGANWVGLYDSAGNRLTAVGVDGRVTSTGLFVEAVNVPLTPGTYRAAFLFSAATGPAVYRNNDLTAGMANAGISTPAQYRYASGGTAQTALPATIDPATHVASQSTYWAAIG